MGRQARKDDDGPAAVPLGTKLKPSQSRARNTFETVLSTAGELLAEVGFERLTTNLVCERAGLTPPALYRYFPNKYAILSELARRLMEAQDEAVLAWMEAGGLEADSLAEAVEKNRRMQEQVNEITRQMPGGIWIMRALRAIPLLRDIRIASRDRVALQISENLRQRFPTVPQDELFRAARLSTELMYAATEMVLEEPEQDEARVNEEVCWMVALYYNRLAERHAAAR
ncbi:MAG: TetR family transcriptional regulator [Phenylobacterium sp. RIFCSPHIGHO2_01_FULL_69_31]|jgi:AcrR family transcriptional regulator|uniref:TetR/AcrR family transcriptional regulator n=1 Tax=Phenylobacterium sp. RIFCSPHIGHO2_01_FULL_69_31 TaxID=1801944 RepID=UPI0008C7CE31|nr:TetR/AcrR family transcriptional regulator [Phenylobacterium sp. RIFCSPHIGHO2_01_FULL_69_31]OHB26142.1 MAG: TetR family transcriptional regulator [Phenylobacterium sp. RIFCSPHIGHO2_01_FULL_69_31]